MKTENISTYLSEHPQSYRAAYLISGFIKKTLTEEEARELDYWILASESNMQLFEDLTDERMVDFFLNWYAKQDIEVRLAAIKERIVFKKKSAIGSIFRYAAAACLILFSIIAVYWFVANENNVAPGNKQNLAEDILPGKALATLTIAGTKQILLTTDTSIGKSIRISNGEVIYTSSAEEPVTEHEISIPRKAYYKLVLPDGSRVWLNSESSIRYPSAFNDNDRRVSVTGETYFEVAHDAAKPFIVSVNGVDIQALGTAFNINAYANENGLLTTLIEGSVKITNADKKSILLPDQQLLINEKGWKLASNIDPSAIIAWKNNEFKLKDASIGEVMRQLERWYDAKIVYESAIDFHFNGTMSRNEPVSKVLELLEKTEHVHFEIKGNTITVRK